ncbi:hypothetical protein NESM_000551400 [Novymonas esmeraldas]|uniref:Uncharacterized protein n=1 Tax=Novymonas esmeraldas TaxID=1808958 RepID=A0AAW0ER11_9TRYP
METGPAPPHDVHRSSVGGNVASSSLLSTTLCVKVWENAARDGKREREERALMLFAAAPPLPAAASRTSSICMRAHVRDKVYRPLSPCITTLYLSISLSLLFLFFFLFFFFCAHHRGSVLHTRSLSPEKPYATHLFVLSVLSIYTHTHTLPPPPLTQEKKRKGKRHTPSHSTSSQP